MPLPHLVREMRRAEAAASEAERRVMALTCGIVSETTISDYLSLLSSATEIQPLNRIATDIHRKDEAAHGLLFRAIAPAAFQAMTPGERLFAASFLPDLLLWFADPELEMWRSLLRQIDFPRADDLVDECLAAHGDALGGRDFSAVDALARELGLAQGPERQTAST